MVCVGAFNEAGNSGDRKRGVAGLNDAGIRLVRCEGVIGDFRLGCREARNQRGLSGVGKPDETGIGEQFQLEAQPQCVSGFALFVFSWRLVGGGSKPRIAAATASAFSNGEALTGFGEIEELLAGVGVIYDRADGNRQFNGVAFAASTIAAFAVAAAF